MWCNRACRITNFIGLVTGLQLLVGASKAGRFPYPPVDPWVEEG